MQHRFIVIIPVADRPRHLTNILASLLALCRTFGYGGAVSGRWQKISAIVADDSADENAVRRHQEITREFDGLGLPTLYFGAEEQSRLLHSIPAPRRQALRRILGEPEAGGFRHKGASVTRNLACLLAKRISASEDASDDPCLFMFVDSDEQFKVRIAGAHGKPDVDVAAIDYFGCLDRIFSTSDIQILTGKVVGDPPVSPAVMAGTFLADVIAFLERLAAVEPGRPCTFHGGQERNAGDAAYHDMADLFGFTPDAEPFNYRCLCAGTHDHGQCLAEFSARLDRFFDGEHPTRVSHYDAGIDCLATQPARTVYTGNYVCTPAGLAHFIPFAPLKLRMAGPVLGRLIRAEIAARFASANLPLLHTRTDHGDAEFRPGVVRADADVDLGGEFERQFFGDVMLFSVERLIERGYPAQRLADNEIRAVLDEVERMLRDKYDEKRTLVQARLARASALFEDPAMWWNQDPGPAPAGAAFQRFFANIRRNFGAESNGYRLIASSAHRESRLTEMTAVLAAFADDRLAWQFALESMELPVRTPPAGALPPAGETTPS